MTNKADEADEADEETPKAAKTAEVFGARQWMLGVGHGL